VQGAGLVIVEVREEIKMQQKPNKQKKRGGGAGLSEMEVHEVNTITSPKINKQRYGGARL